MWDLGGKDKLVSLCLVPKFILIPLVPMHWFEDLEVLLKVRTPRVLIDFVFCELHPSGEDRCK